MPAERGATTSRMLNRLAYDLANADGGGTDIGVVASGDRIPIYDTSAELVGYTFPGALSLVPVALTATTTITAALHANRTLLMGASGAALTFTLPAATGTGNKYRFVVTVVNTSNYLIKSVVGSDLMEGCVIGDDGAAVTTTLRWQAGATDDTITLNGTTSGGVDIGDWIELEDITSVGWAVRGVVSQSGAEVTPFSDTVA